MAELILTEEEKAMPFWSDLDDASLGRAVKCFGIRFLNIYRGESNDDGGMDLIMKAATIFVACSMYKMNADTLTSTLKGVTLKGEHIGDWEITYKRMNGVQDAE